jgi:hypothetical protein
MNNPLLCVVCLVLVGWVVLLKLEIDELRRQLAAAKGNNGASSSSSSKGMRSFQIGRKE